MKFPEFNISMLYAVSLKAIGTGTCESLTSYIMRLSREHNITNGVLISKIVAPILDSKYILNSSVNGGNRFYDGAKSLNAFDKNALEFIRVLGLLTQRIDLKDTTLLDLKSLISSRDLLKNTLAWCPACLEEWKEENAYYPLAWFFKDIKVCVQHNCGLEEICFSCEKQLPILHRKGLIGYCPYCNKWLGASKPKGIKKHIDLLKAREVSTLIANRSFLAQKNNKKSISDTLLQLINCYTNGNLAEFARLANIPKVTLWDWAYGGRLPSLGKILDICFSINISLMQFFNGDFQLDCKLNAKVEQKRAGKTLIRRKINQQELQRRLEDFLLKRSELSLSKVSKILGYDRKVLTSNFPEICRLIVKQNKEYCIQQKDNRYLELIGSMDKVVNHLYKNEIYPSRRKIENFLGKPGLLHEKQIREAWLEKISE
ncbi:TniQ family protein [Bacillus mycoides]|uniref:TniQ family protein n=1 Tax=Bacillus mycoides TaxID=1405 RepID=UPI0011A32F65|nr:TniQ family protein [Bacillus mycoides]